MAIAVIYWLVFLLRGYNKPGAKSMSAQATLFGIF
jgi:hypothetical protein